MLKRPLTALLLVCVALSGAWADEVEVTGVAVRKAPARNIDGLFFQRPGVEIELLITVEDGSILGVDSANCSITKLMCDKDTDLSRTRGFGEVPWLGSFPKFSNDAKVAQVSIVTERLPASGASWLIVDATVALSVGVAHAPVTRENIALKPGTKVELGQIKAEVTEVGPGFGDGVRVSFQAKQSFETLRSIEFVDASGKVLEARDGGSSSFGFNNDHTYTKSWILPAETETATIKASVWTGIESKPVRVEKMISLGL